MVNAEIIPAGPTELDKNRTQWPESEKRELAEKIRKYFINRVDLLRQIPSLALEADGRSGWSDSFGRNYDWCMHELHDDHGYYDVFVELRTGELVHVQSYHDPFHGLFSNDPDHVDIEGVNLATDEQVLKLATEEEPFNIEEYVQMLREYAQKPYWSGYQPAENEAHKEKYREKLKEKMKLSRANLPENLR